MKLRNTQVKTFQALTPADLETLVNAWFDAQGEGELVSVEIETQFQEEAGESYLTATVVYTRG